MTTRSSDDMGGRFGGEAAASASVREQRRLLDEMADADRSAWSWFPPIFVAAFTLLSFAGTYIGLRDIIATGDMRNGVVGDFLVMLLVLLATGAMVFFLRRAVLNFWSLGGVASFGAYLLLLFFSVTFGFAFYWGRLEASGQAISGATQSLEQLSDEIQISAFALRSTADDLTALSTEFAALAERERTQGGTCGDGSGGGYGPRTRHRERRAQEIAARVAQIQPRFAAVGGPVALLETELKKIEALSKPGGLNGVDDFDLSGGLADRFGAGVDQTLGGRSPDAGAKLGAQAGDAAGGAAERRGADLSDILDGAQPEAAEPGSPAQPAQPSSPSQPGAQAAAPVAAPQAASPIAPPAPKPAFDAETLRNNPGAARQKQFRETRLAARRAAVEINALSADATLAGMAAEFRRWGEEYQNPALIRRDDPQGAPYKCIQYAVGARLLSAAERLENLPKVSAPDLPDFAGAGATREAVFRMLDSAGSVATGGGALEALFSEETSALTPAGEAALRSRVGAAVQNAGGQAAAPVAEVKGLKPQDRFPLAVAFIIDMLLFAFVLIERPGRKYFDRMKKRVGDAVKEEFDPLSMVAMRQALEQDPEWRLLKEYRFDADDRTFLVVPVVRSLPKKEVTEDGEVIYDIAPEGSFQSHDDNLEVSVLRDVVMLWRRNRILRRAYFKPDALRENLIRAGRPELAAWDVLECYEFLPSGFEQLLLSGMTAERRTARLQEQARRRDWGRSLGRALPTRRRDDRREIDYDADVETSRRGGSAAQDARYDDAFEDQPYDREPEPKRGWRERLGIGSGGAASAAQDAPMDDEPSDTYDLDDSNLDRSGARRSGRLRTAPSIDEGRDDPYYEDDYEEAGSGRGLFPFRRARRD